MRRVRKLTLANPIRVWGSWMNTGTIPSKPSLLMSVQRITRQTCNCRTHYFPTDIPREARSVYRESTCTYSIWPLPQNTEGTEAQLSIWWTNLFWTITERTEPNTTSSKWATCRSTKFTEDSAQQHWIAVILNRSRKSDSFRGFEPNDI